jgi:hypothetical protein
MKGKVRRKIRASYKEMITYLHNCFLLTVIGSQINDVCDVCVSVGE